MGAAVGARRRELERQALQVWAVFVVACLVAGAWWFVAAVVFYFAAGGGIGGLGAPPDGPDPWAEWASFIAYLAGCTFCGSAAYVLPESWRMRRAAAGTAGRVRLTPRRLLTTMTWVLVGSTVLLVAGPVGIVLGNAARS
jgi:hypothetical protein